MTGTASTFTPDEQQAIRERLAEEHASTAQRVHSLTRQIDDMVESATWANTDDEHDPEGVTLAYERAQLQSLLRGAREELDELDRATKRLETSRYGLCEHCGQAIDFQRLLALPATRRCIKCTGAR